MNLLTGYDYHVNKKLVEFSFNDSRIINPNILEIYNSNNF